MNDSSDWYKYLRKSNLTLRDWIFIIVWPIFILLGFRLLLF